MLLVVITSDRGLAGAYNANVIKAAKAVIAERYSAQQAQGNVKIWNIGKKGYEAMVKANYKTDATYKDIFLDLRFETVQACAQAAVKGFENKEFDVVEIVYSEFKNAATQRFVVERFLPIPKVTAGPNAKKAILSSNPIKKN